jgi:hypothetical protein
MNLLDKLTNLLVMAAVDRSFTEREIHFLLNRCVRWGISQQEFARALEYACSDEAELRIPPNKEDRINLLQDLIRVMAADGDLADVEKRLFATAAAKMQFAGPQIDDIIDSVLGSSDSES